MQFNSAFSIILIMPSNSNTQPMLCPSSRFFVLTSFCTGMLQHWGGVKVTGCECKRACAIKSGLWGGCGLWDVRVWLRVH